MLISETLRKYNEWGAGRECQGVVSGFDVIDRVYQGWAPGELCVIGGRPGMGKTTFVLSIIRHHVSQRIPTALFTHDDIRNPKYLQRVLCAITGQKPESEMWKMQELIDQTDLSGVPFYIQSKTRLTMDYIRTEAQRLVTEEGVKCIFIEDLQTIFDSEGCGVVESNNDRICYSLRELARELQVPFVVTSELNRGPEYREGVEGKQPRMGDLRASSAIETAADAVWLLHRPEYYHIYFDENGNCLRGSIYVLIQKNSYGPTGDYTLVYREGRILSKSDDSVSNSFSLIGHSSDAPF